MIYVYMVYGISQEYVFFVCRIIYINAIYYMYMYIRYMYRQDRLRALRFLDSVIAAPGNPSRIYSYAPIHLLYYIYANHASYYLYTLFICLCVCRGLEGLFIRRAKSKRGKLLHIYSVYYVLV